MNMVEVKWQRMSCKHEASCSAVLTSVPAAVQG